MAQVRRHDPSLRLLRRVSKKKKTTSFTRSRSRKEATLGPGPGQLLQSKQMGHTAGSDSDPSCRAPSSAPGQSDGIAAGYGRPANIPTLSTKNKRSSGLLRMWLLENGLPKPIHHPGDKHLTCLCRIISVQLDKGKGKEAPQSKRLPNSLDI
ncbi:hypothetical protein ABEF92_006407 [Exophiala dermatitidis]|uniref:Uncharacterized protein n=1 Tax=Exophiala dermatitidis (strain ATCC 34100 / CBS 525.76 / NIH/UT8656) TaxID=858893 RepID=H6BQ83_EXODN|nr:uncharacterized protein HMPREF1120_01938 [Exophiala dermatitidis NIH/UT8656]EHY53754.1 hypothetical protein HMPREF1120_01938 [Exophiala dermatitidis NIH/UT8656]